MIRWWTPRPGAGAFFYWSNPPALASDLACATLRVYGRGMSEKKPEKKPSRQQVYTLLVQIGRKEGDGLPNKATGAALMIYASGVDEAEAVRETVANLRREVKSEYCIGISVRTDIPEILRDHIVDDLAVWSSLSSLNAKEREGGVVEDCLEALCRQSNAEAREDWSREFNG